MRLLSDGARPRTLQCVLAGQSLAVDLPNGPAKAGWDITRFSNLGNGWFETFYVEKTEPLQHIAEGRAGPSPLPTAVAVPEGAALPTGAPCPCPNRSLRRRHH